MNRITLIASGFLSIFTIQAWSHSSSLHGQPNAMWVAVETKDKRERSRLVNLGVSIEQVVDDTSYGFAPDYMVPQITAAGFTLKSSLPATVFQRTDFPAQDAPYRNYQEQMVSIHELVQKKPQLVTAFSIGKTLQGRDIWAIRINSDMANADDRKGLSSRPGIIFMGGHHAREHLSVETPLNIAAYLVDNYDKDAALATLMNNRDIFIIPNVNPDGAEFDIASGQYQMWRKNRANNAGNRCKGVDLNRNYGFMWGTGGSSKDPCSDVYMGPNAFSEPESQAIKNFVEAHPNLKILLSFHTFSELILYPWGHKYDAIERSQDLATYKKMAETMARWNGYTPEQSSELYIASGDTTDWSYGQLGIFSFTFELSPADQWSGGGFYPGVGAIQKTLDANIKPVLYLLDLADSPTRAIQAPETTLFFGSGGRH